MFWFTIFLIYPSISSAFYLSSLFGDPFDSDDDSIFFRDYPNESNINVDVFRMPTTTVKPTTPDIDGGDDSCVGRLELLRFNTGPDSEENRRDITVLKLNSFENLHWTAESLLRMPLYKAFLSQSMIRIDSPQCSRPEIRFERFTLMSRGNPPPLNRPFRSVEYHVENVRTPNGTAYENCFGFIKYIKIMQLPAYPDPLAKTVIKLHNEPVEHYTIVPHHRELLMDAFFYNYEVQILSNSCSNSEDYGFAAFRIIQPEG